MNMQLGMEARAQSHLGASRLPGQLVAAQLRRLQHFQCRLQEGGSSYPVANDAFWSRVRICEELRIDPWVDRGAACLELRSV
jgi:hypothetical protein